MLDELQYIIIGIIYSALKMIFNQKTFLLL